MLTSAKIGQVHYVDDDCAKENISGVWSRRQWQ